MISDLISQRACRTMSSVRTEATSSGMGYNEHPASPAAHKQLSHLTLRIVAPLTQLTLVVALTFAEPVAPRTFKRQIASPPLCSASSRLLLLPVWTHIHSPSCERWSIGT